ncbi:hypothetical protein SLS58_005663 [Diplodia intermedia]|uniref:Necrosis and ethylene inducing peptide 1 n=1 Tax=Diplodia intermedia TaxID=856260 RepID=A0ABR3TQ72_9PEZI
MHYSNLITLFAAASCAVAAPAADPESIQALDTRAPTVPHDSLWPMPERVRGGVEGNAIRRYEPFLHIASGCQPYTAVNDRGQVSGGLDNTGSATGGCRDDRRGQTYARGVWHRGRYAIMYSWYFPKDQISDGGGNFGHRHDWENVVIWIDNPGNANPRVFGAGASGHGNYKKTGAPPMRNGNRLQVEYMTNFPSNHELQFKTSPGREQWMIDWQELPKASRDALNEHKWGAANCPFNDGNFIKNLNNAWV